MADYRTEEEQIELLKKWWRENGKSTVAGVVIALAGYAGWMGWTSHQQSTMAAAADQYQQLLVAAETPDGQGKAAEMAEQLRNQHPHTVYGAFAALYLAKNAVLANDLVRAGELLAWAREQSADPSLKPLVSLREAQVLYAKGEYEQALSALAGIREGDAWEPAAAELRGDILLAQGKPQEARASYEAALKALDNSGMQDRRAELEMKLADLAASPTAPAAATEGGKP
jgi:predicted negative regulator of RcsB-dependent stress response